MQGMMLSTSQSSNKGVLQSSSVVGGNLQHNLLLQQGITSSQLGERYLTL